MEPVSAEAGLAESAGERDRVGDLRVSSVEGRVEAGDVEGVGVMRAGGRESGEARRLVERVEREEGVELAGDRVVDGDRSREPRSAVDDAVADGERPSRPARPPRGARREARGRALGPSPPAFRARFPPARRLRAR